jgi:hypothetical protein
MQDIKGNMGQCKSKDQGFKEQKRSKVLKNREKKQSKRREKKKEVMRLLYISIQAPSTLDPRFLHVCLLSFVLSASATSS